MSANIMYKPALVGRLLGFEPFVFARMSSEARRVTVKHLRNSINFQCGSVEDVKDSTDNALFLYADPAGIPFDKTWLEFTYRGVCFGVLASCTAPIYADGSLPGDERIVDIHVYCDPTCSNRMEPLDVWVSFGHRIEGIDCISGFDDHREISDTSRALCEMAAMGTRIMLNYINMPAVSYKTGRRSALKRGGLSGRRRKLYEHKVLVLDKSKISESSGAAGTHSSPRAHLRRGHERRLRSGNVVWISETAVGDKSKGIITKDYDLLS